MLKRLFPHPYLTLTLVVLWFLLVNQWKIGSLVMAIFLATVCGLCITSMVARGGMRLPLRVSAVLKKAVLVPTGWTLVVAMPRGRSSTRRASAKDNCAALVAE